MEELSNLIEFGKLLTALVAIAAAVWAFQKWRARDELFPRVFFEVSINFIGKRDDQIICELVAVLENKGIVPLKLRNMIFVVKGLLASGTLESGGDDIRHQLDFKHNLLKGAFIPSGWNYTFIYPGVRTEYNYVATIPAKAEFVRMQSDFDYEEPGRSHHAAKVLAVPNFDPD